MALAKSIRNVRTGHANAYWRLTGISIDAHTGCVLIVLSGYVDLESRTAGRAPDDRRDWILSGPAFAAVAFALAQGATVYDVIANSCYSIIKTERRPIPPGTERDEAGNLTLSTGELVAAAEVDESSEIPTIPSEFADAVDV